MGKLIVDPYRVRNEGGLAGMRCSKEKTEDRLVGVTRSGREAKGEKEFWFFLLILLWIYPLRILYICFFYVDVFVFVVLVFVVLNTPKVNMFVVFCYFFWLLPVSVYVVPIIYIFYF